MGAALAMPALFTSTSTEPKASTDAADGGIPLPLVGDIEVHEQGAIAELGGERRAGVVEQSATTTRAPARVQRADVRLAEAARAAGHDRDPAAEDRAIRAQASVLLIPVRNRSVSCSATSVALSGPSGSYQCDR